MFGLCISYSDDEGETETSSGVAAAVAMVGGFLIYFFIFLYGGLVYGVLPILPGVSWESHLLGGIVGFFLALNYSSLKNV